MGACMVHAILVCAGLQSSVYDSDLICHCLCSMMVRKIFQLAWYPGAAGFKCAGPGEFRRVPGVMASLMRILRFMLGPPGA